MVVQILVVRLLVCGICCIGFVCFADAGLKLGFSRFQYTAGLGLLVIFCEAFYWFEVLCQCRFGASAGWGFSCWLEWFLFKTTKLGGLIMF